MVVAEPKLTFDEAISAWDREAFRPKLVEGERERAAVVEKFPLDGWPTLPLERYALGTSDSADSFCRWMEYRTPTLASIGGGSARKHLIYKRLNEPGWYFDARFANEREAWDAVRAGFVRAFDLAAQGRFLEIGAIEAIGSAFALVTKTIYVYFPSDVLPVCAREHQQHFWRLLGGEGDLVGGVPAARKLLQLAKERPQLADWSALEIMWLLYRWADPRETSQIVKIAPGPDAKYWEDCLAAGHIRVGYDGMGDLTAFASKEEFQARFNAEYAAFFHQHQATMTEKGNELWTLVELQPGDRIVANKGTAQVVGIGTVVEPGYEFRPELGEFAQTVRVQWNDPTLREIDPIKKWAFKTVARVSQADFQRILEGKHAEHSATGSKYPPKVVAPPSAPSLYYEIESALKRKGQVILYGPPGTGKTYTAEHFSVWWLARQLGDKEADGLLVDKARFARTQRSLSTVQSERRVWWVVANPTEWAWDTLFKDGVVDYRYGRLQKNYALLQPGDLVVGYQANPDKRILALARIKEPLHASGEGQVITIEKLARVANGPTYDELTKHPLLGMSEPIRNRNQGTLFALTASEADELLAWLAERDPSLPSFDAESAETIGPLTRVTFHPSYGYEDFIEGFKPIPTGTGQLDLRLQDGVFKRVCRAAQACPNQPFILFIDEINRGNIAKIFGELITLLELDKRDLPVVLPQSGESFKVPPNVLVLGTMNTADRSIKLLDAALRRRFAFLELMPDTSLLEGARIGGLDLAAFLGDLNRRIAKAEGREKQIGHSFFLDGQGQPVADPDRFAEQLRHEIIPLLQEYAYDDYRELADYLGTALVDVDQQRLVMEKVTDPQVLIAALAEAYPQAAGAPVDETLG